MIHTGDIEVVRGGSSPKPSSRYPAPPSDRPRVFSRSVAGSDEEDKTLMMPTKMRTTIAPPRPANAPPSVRPVAPPSLKGLVKPRIDEERTMLRPASAEEQAMLRPSSRPAAPSSRPPSPAMMPTPYMPFKPPTAAKKSAPPPPLPVNAKGGSDKKPGDSDARLEVPAAVITTKTRILPRKPSMQWAAALVALGVFTGLVTAVVARGDADSLLDATASLVDPTAARPAAAPPPGMQLPAAVVIPANAGGSSALPAGAATACGTDSPASPVAQAPVVNTPPVAAATATPTTAKPEPPKPPPVAWAAPRAYAPPVGVAPAAPPAPKPVAQPQPQAPQQVAAAPRPAAPSKPAPAAPAPKGGGSEMESAAAADALAKAQLEASLR